MVIYPALMATVSKRVLIAVILLLPGLAAHAQGTFDRLWEFNEGIAATRINHQVSSTNDYRFTGTVNSLGLIGQYNKKGQVTSAISLDFDASYFVNGLNIFSDSSDTFACALSVTSNNNSGAERLAFLYFNRNLEILFSISFKDAYNGVGLWLSNNTYLQTARENAF